jgi:ribosomal protein S18 acetylase RimI-like enzyme
MTPGQSDFIVRTTRPADFPSITEICRQVYPFAPPWTEVQLGSHLRVFPEGQFVAVHRHTQQVAGMAASLIVRWDDYDFQTGWKDFTDNGMFTNHDPEHGRTLYGAEVFVDPSLQRQGIGGLLYEARRKLTQDLHLLRIRAGARLRNYSLYADRLTAGQYVSKVLQGEISDPTLTFQIRQGFRVIGVVSNYLLRDPESLGYAAVIEWLNPEVANPEDLASQAPHLAPA